jgi:pseudaminic acid cytidylyltransferase
MNIAIIPARGGSKRIPRKNIKVFHGKPMIAYSIEAAKKSGCFDRIIVSTDDKEIAEIAMKFGAEVPFIRPADISDDHATTSDVIKHAINWYKIRNYHVHNVCCIYATAPFLLPEYITEGLKALSTPEVEFAFGVTTFPFPIQRALLLSESGGVEMLSPEHLNTRSQDLQETYHDAGQFYWGKEEAFSTGKSVFSQHSVPIFLPRKRVQDIDSIEDWDSAEVLFSIV